MVYRSTEYHLPAGGLPAGASPPPVRPCISRSSRLGRKWPPPTCSLRRTAARVFWIWDGSVKVRKAGTYEWIDANTGMALSRDDTIRTVGGSQARVRLFDRTEYLVKSDSILVIEEAYEDPHTKAKLVAVKLTAGQVNLKTPRGGVTGSRSDLSTPTSEATFEEDTSADVSFDSSSRVSGFTVFNGGSDVRSGGQSISLSSAQAVDVTADSRFSNIIELPDVPVIETPANHSVVAVTASTEFRWRSVGGARKYHVELDRSPYFRDPLLESTVPNVSILHKGLTPGTYYWQVTAIDSNNRRGAPSEFAKIHGVISRRCQERESAPADRLQTNGVSGRNRDREGLDQLGGRRDR